MKNFAGLLRLIWLVAFAAWLVSCGGSSSDDSQVGSTKQKVCSGGSLVSDVPGNSGVVGTVGTVNWTASANCDFANPEYSFWIYPSAGGGWANVQPFSTSPTYAWDTTGLGAGTYFVTVWIHDAGGSASTIETSADRTFQLNAGASCTNGGISATPTSPSPGPVAFTGTSSSCSSPQYKFWVAPPGGAYALARDWGSATFNWDTSGLALGTYSISVWVRDSQSVSQYETYAQMYYTVSSTNSPPCTGGALTATPPSPAQGTNVTLTASASTCTSSSYRFYIAPPGGAYTLVRDWGGPSYTWDTSALAAGRYSISVWISSLGSAAGETYQTYAQQYYTVLGGTTCSGGSLSASPASPQAVNTPITFTASASGCTSPEYQFYLAPPGGAYAMVRDWGGPTYNWDTNLLASGTYSAAVWIRNTGSPLGYETTGQTYYTLTFTTTGSTVTNFTAGLYHTCVLRADGTVDCWGYNYAGQVGQDASTTIVSSPLAVSGISGATAIGAGYAHTCAVVGGGVKCWGEGSSGQLGNGTQTASATPVSVSGLSTATGIAGGAAHTCALLTDGTVNCWGYSSQGAIGVSGTLSTTPVVVSGVSGAVAVSAGYYHSCALLSTGRVSCWGGNANGQLGNGTTTNSNTPVVVSNLQDVVSIGSSSSHNCALLANHTVRCWGQNINGGNGDGTTTDSSTPTTVSGINNAVAIGVSPDSACAALSDGTAKCWGLNSEGGLGDGTTNNSSTPVAVAGLTGTTVTAMGVGWKHSCAAFADNTVNCWGWGAQGELGNGALASSLTPVVVTLP